MMKKIPASDANQMQRMSQKHPSTDIFLTGLYIYGEVS